MTKATAAEALCTASTGCTAAIQRYRCMKIAARMVVLVVKNIYRGMHVVVGFVVAVVVEVLLVLPLLIWPFHNQKETPCSLFLLLYNCSYFFSPLYQLNPWAGGGKVPGQRPTSFFFPPATHRQYDMQVVTVS